MNRRILWVVAIAPALLVAAIAYQGFQQTPFKAPSELIDAQVIDIKPWQEAGLDHDPNEGEPATPSPEEVAQEAADEQQAKDEAAIADREGPETQLVLAEPAIANQLKNKFTWWTDYYPAELRDDKANEAGRDLIKVTVVTKRVEVGDIENGFQRTSTGMYEINAEVKDGKVVGYATKQLPDVEEPLTYSDVEKGYIKILQSNPEIAKLLEGRNWLIGFYGIPVGKGSIEWPGHGCELETCMTVTIMKAGTHEGLQFHYDVKAGKIIDLTVSEGW